MKLKNLAIGGYRSFGSVQYFDNFSKINLFIGRNNSGKSNVLRFINEVYSSIGADNKSIIDPITKHLPLGKPLVIGIGDYVKNDARKIDEIPRFNSEEYSRLGKRSRSTIFEIFNNKIKNEETNLCWTLRDIPSLNVHGDSWRLATKSIHDNYLHELWSELTNYRNGSRNADWIPAIENRLPAKI